MIQINTLYFVRFVNSSRDLHFNTFDFNFRSILHFACLIDKLSGKKPSNVFGFNVLKVHIIMIQKKSYTAFK